MMVLTAAALGIWCFRRRQDELPHIDVRYPRIAYMLLTGWSRLARLLASLAFWSLGASHPRTWLFSIEPIIQSALQACDKLVIGLINALRERRRCKGNWKADDLSPFMSPLT